MTDKHPDRVERLPDVIVHHSVGMEASPSRRRGLSERRLLTGSDSPFQNIVLVDAEAGATVESHEVQTAESLFVLYGRFEISSPGGRVEVTGGDLCYFPPASQHGMRCTEGPGAFLVIFAPPKSSDTIEKVIQSR